jgi:hypothetical protein
MRRGGGTSSQNKFWNFFDFFLKFLSKRILVTFQFFSFEKMGEKKNMKIL